MDRNMKEICKDIRCDIMTCIGHLGVGHIGGCLSIVELLAVLYFEEMNIDPAQPKMEGRDRFICSKGHAGPAVYSTLALKGYFPMEMLKTLNKPGTNLPSHCDMNRTPGIDMTTGSLGQGASSAMGICAANRLKGYDNYTYLVLGDGEIEEGQVWEAAMFAAHCDLDNLIAIVDNNNLQIDGDVRDVVGLAEIPAKFKAFGWEVIEVNGHDAPALLEAFAAAKAVEGKPVCIVAATTKGKGVSFMENQAGWHGKAPNAEQTEQAIAELKGE